MQHPYSTTQKVTLQEVARRCSIRAILSEAGEGLAMAEGQLHKMVETLECKTSSQ